MSLLSASTIYSIESIMAKKLHKMRGVFGCEIFVENFQNYVDLKADC